MSPRATTPSAWRELRLLLLLAILPALASAWLHPHRPAWSWRAPAVAEISLAELNRHSAPVVLVDARNTTAYDLRHIPGAVSLNEDNWDRLLPGLFAVWQPGVRVIVYCDSSTCAASQQVALRLQRELQIANVAVLRGGWSAWLEEQAP